MMGTKGALEAMQTNEKMTVHRYKAALDKNLNQAARDLLSKNLDDEYVHLEYIDNLLCSHDWK
jgi:hypothetical protein